MPLYVWRCPNCKHEQEQLVSNWFAALESRFDCEQCGTEMERMVSAPAVQFEGPGWAKDGYSKGGKS